VERRIRGKVVIDENVCKKLLMGFWEVIGLERSVAENQIFKYEFKNGRTRNTTNLRRKDHIHGRHR